MRVLIVVTGILDYTLKSEHILDTEGAGTFAEP